MQNRLRFVPFVRNIKIRTTIGFILLFLSVIPGRIIFCGGRIDVIVLITVFSWILAVFLTDKYVHKYPQRYFPYLIASHLKAAVIMAFFLWVMSWIAGSLAAPHDVLWTGYLFFVFVDFVISVPRRRDTPEQTPSEVALTLSIEKTVNSESSDSCDKEPSLCNIDTKVILRQVKPVLESPVANLIEENLPDLKGDHGDVWTIDELPRAMDNQPASKLVGLFVSRLRLNDVRRLNRFFLLCAKRVAMGGYLVCRYVPLTTVQDNFRHRYKGPAYWPAFLIYFAWRRAFPKIPWLNTLYFFITKGKNRVVSKTEVWGRLSYCGMNVVAETTENDEVYLIAQRVSLPAQNKKPSYYPIVALEKVGLDGKIVRTHKIRSMFPFSEFIQKRVFEDNGLDSGGKFRNDFRLTEYGSFIRKYWVDEVPQVFDWLRGTIKLVGIRPTSRHFLSLYPKHFLELYVQIKPGFISPIFDDEKDGFEEILQVELAYLQRYCEHPLRTDVRCLIQTFTDIVFKGIRSH